MKPDLELPNNNIRFNQNTHPLVKKNESSIKTDSSTQRTPFLRTLKQQTDQAYRQQWISDAAYYKSITRTPKPGHEMADWLEAEQEYVVMLVNSFLAQCKEDETMTVADLQRLAKVIGVQRPERINSKLKLIRLIQAASHHHPCFKTNLGEFCDQQTSCQWSAECHKLIAEWWR